MMVLRDRGWQEFRWAAWRDRSRAAILVPARLEGASVDYWLQLDTGAATSVLYGLPPGSRGSTVSSSRGQWCAVVAGFEPSPPLSLAVSRIDGTAPSRADAPIGTLGLDAILGRVLVLDLRRQRFVVLEARPPSTSGLPWLPVSLAKGKAIVPARIRGVEAGLFYDTGASAFAAVTTAALWREITGRDGTEADNSVLDVPSWGQTVRLVGAKAHGAIQIAALHRSYPLVFHDPTDAAFDFAAVNADGLLGNELFHDRTVILDLIDNAFCVTEAPIDLSCRQ